MIAWDFVGIRIVLPARLKLPVPGSVHQDFTQQTSSWANPKLMASTWCLSVFGRLVEIHFDLFEWSCIFTCLGFWLRFGQQRMVNKTWDDGEEQNCCQVYKTFPLLTISKSVIIEDPHGAKKTCLSVIGDHPGFRRKNWKHGPM